MVNYIASVDCGNGNTAAMLAGSKKSISFPSIRARITFQTLGLGQGHELDFTSAVWHDNTYAVGDDALLVNRQGIDRHMGVNRYGGEHHQFLTAYALARLGIKSGGVDLTLLCPPAMYNDLKQRMIDAYTAQPVEITLKGDKKPRQWTYDSVTVLPEGYAAEGCIMLDPGGTKWALAAKLAGDVVLLDTGAYTANVFRLHNGAFNPADLPQSSIQNGGGNTHIRLPLLEWVHGAGGDLTAVTLDDIDRTLRLGSASGDYMLRFGSVEVDLNKYLPQLARQYADWLANNALDTRYDGLKDISGLLVVGGNASYIMPYLQEWYGKVIDYTGWREFSGLHPADLNTAGGLRLAQARLAAKK
ncbi:MAG: ParM/StbA family protein [Anaerolineae bacterium]|nr:ParM/StbA family protein [Anaerolineae bacterium]